MLFVLDCTLYVNWFGTWKKSICTLYIFLRTTTAGWEKSQGRSIREINQECTFLGFHDYHGIRHFLSGLGLFFVSGKSYFKLNFVSISCIWNFHTIKCSLWLRFYFTLEDGLWKLKPSQIKVFWCKTITPAKTELYCSIIHRSRELNSKTNKLMLNFASLPYVSRIDYNGWYIT